MVNSIPKSESLNSVSLRSGTTERCLSLIHPFNNNILEVLASAVRQEKEDKKIAKEDV